jgi:hypothetical protein
MPRFSPVLLFAFLLLGACAGHSDYMADVPATKATYAPAPNKALVVFMRPSGLGFAIQSSVFDITNGDPAFIAIVPAKKKVAHQVPAGTYRFMVIGESASFLDATLVAGKTYYAVVDPRMGMWKARFAFEPVHEKELGSADLKGWLNDCTWVETTPQALQWSKDNMPSIKEKKSDYLQEWTQSQDKAVLLAADGK